ncbi:PREDICTED: signal transducing adapter molecule 1 [Ceratosolen solmsi marchali]|uniref:Signal transducing adapter molecule 1 n=1 Tax=Ceratosolen solmsi marchali TaxID=326594 RepID=A0AAJ6YSH6_9HYME|nr:PREDICTED: signal transducing adapter molecule 1 [Ceratosolen solmsi marchali]
MKNFLSSSLPFDADVEKATNHKSTTEDWALIMEICDKLGRSPQFSKHYLRSIVKRLNAQDPHIVILAITLLDACSSNCGKPFHLEIASREFEGQFIKLIQNNRTQPKIYEKLKALLKKWAEGDFKTDPQLNLIPSLYQKLKLEGHDFSAIIDMPRPNYVLSKDPNVVTSAQEEEEIAKAIELSLKENTKHSTTSHNTPPMKKSPSIYPNVNSTLVGTANSEGRKVKALYDFEAVEDNELTFSAGEIINILDDSDPNWWKGSNHRGEGLFPSNFVTADLSVELEQFTKLESNNKKSVQFTEEVEVKTVKREPEVVEIEIDEQKMDRLLHLLHEADPQSDSSDPQEMLDLEEHVTAMGPLIDTALEKVDKQHAKLTQLSSDLVDAMNLYHMLMREPAISSYTHPKMPPQQMVYQYPHPQGASHSQTGGHPQAGHPQQGHLQGGHPQGGHSQIGHPQAVPSQSGLPQGAPPHIFNGLPSGPQSQTLPGTQPRFNTNIPPTGDLITTQQGPTSLPTMTLPHHFHMPPGLRQIPSEVRQESQQSNQNNIPYTQGFPVQSSSVGPAPFVSQVPPDQQINNQQSQFASPNGQRMM